MNDVPIDELAERLRRLVAERAGKLRPFPAFLGMTTIQAIELEPDGPPQVEWGCVVVTPDGAICELDLVGIAGVAGVGPQDFIEEMRELDLPSEEYVIYAQAAINALENELKFRQG